MVEACWRHDEEMVEAWEKWWRNDGGMVEKWWRCGGGMVAAWWKHG